MSEDEDDESVARAHQSEVEQRYRAEQEEMMADVHYWHWVDGLIAKGLEELYGKRRDSDASRGQSH